MLYAKRIEIAEEDEDAFRRRWPRWDWRSVFGLCISSRRGRGASRRHRIFPVARSRPRVSSVSFSTAVKKMRDPAMTGEEKPLGIAVFQARFLRAHLHWESNIGSRASAVGATKLRPVVGYVGEGEQEYRQSESHREVKDIRSSYWMLIVTALAVWPSTVRITLDSPLPRSVRGTGTLTWSSPANAPCWPAYSTGTFIPLIVQVTAVSELRLRMPVPYSDK